MRSMLLGVVVCWLTFLVPALAAQKAKTARSAWQPETLNGKIVSVDLAQKLVVVKDVTGVPFDMRVTASTRILANGQGLKLDGLKADAGKSVSVRFTPERSGNIAQSIRVAG